MSAFRISQELDGDKRRNLLQLFAAGLLFWLSLSSLLATLPTYIQSLGATPEQVGLVMGSFAIGLLLTRTWMGRLCDRRSRKLVILLGAVVVATAPLGYLLADSVPLLAGIRAYHGICIAGFTTGYSALVVDLAPLKQRGEIVGYMSLVVPVGMAIGPACGGLLQAQVGDGPLFWFSAAAGLLALVLASQVQEPVRPSGVSEEIPGSSRSFWQILGSPALQIPALVLLQVGLIFGILVAFLPLHIADAQIPLNPGWFYTAAAIASFGARLFTGKASDRLGRGLFISISLVFYGASMWLLAQAQLPGELLVAGFLEGAGGGVLVPCAIASCPIAPTPPSGGRVFAICMGGFDVGIALGGPLMGSLASVVGYRGIFQLGALLAALALMVFLTRGSKGMGHSWRFAWGREPDAYAVEKG
ncbi:MAG: MFS transporter [Chloroflexaceae bacterium]|nr:MFS transporter [Chloroflexaceae bacterium]